MSERLNFRSQQWEAVMGDVDPAGSIKAVCATDGRFHDGVQTICVVGDNDLRAPEEEATWAVENCRLIAAAPDLYETVRRYVAANIGGDHLLKFAADALAKARGEA